jgi:hypothetical protein
MITLRELEEIIKGSSLENKFLFIEPQEVVELIIHNAEINKEDFVMTFKEKDLLLGYVGDYNGKFVISRCKEKK